MKNKKKVLWLILAALCLHSFTGCGADDTDKLPEITQKEMEFAEFKWPKSDIAKLIPEPESNVGYIDWEKSYGFVIYVSETSKEAYDSYVEACWERGFTVDYHKSDEVFWAKNDEGYRIHLEYEGDNVMFIRMDDPDEDDTADNSNDDTETTENTEKKDTLPTVTDNTADTSKTDTEKVSDEIRSDFKESLDSYEKFMDEYCEFMKKYKESNDSLSMLTDYTEFLTKYSEMMQKIDGIDQDNLNSAELAYYIEVTSRVSKKLLEVAA